jgi:hypothetical protein
MVMPLMIVRENAYTSFSFTAFPNVSFDLMIALSWIAVFSSLVFSTSPVFWPSSSVCSTLFALRSAGYWILSIAQLFS